MPGIKVLAGGQQIGMLTSFEATTTTPVTRVRELGITEPITFDGARTYTMNIVKMVVSPALARLMRPAPTTPATPNRKARRSEK